MEISSIVELALGSVTALILYFLKIMHTDLREATQNVGENKGKIKTLETQIRHEGEIRSQSYRQIMDRLDEIITDLKEIQKK